MSSSVSSMLEGWLLAPTFESQLRGRAIKTVACEGCGREYVYAVERSAHAVATSVLWLTNRRAKTEALGIARAELDKSLERAVEPFACPSCGPLPGRHGGRGAEASRTPAGSDRARRRVD